MERTKNKSRNKIGARCLTAKEVRLILPTYGQVTKQIEQFRREKAEYCQTGDQKTNNIGIIGSRGAGKTSVLKTIYAELEKGQSLRIKSGESRDVILPIIVPENMSESSTLMATILGMLKSPVHERARQLKNGNVNNGFADCIEESRIEKVYNDVVRQYTFIQKEYRDILIHEFTTENDYVQSSAKVFNSDVEFIKKFNQLIDVLLNEGEEKDTKKDGLLFLFIDDIDLSTHRCADVVRTLLSYLSNPNIVTLISGDLPTFEEALVLDFLRQEKVLDKNIIDKSMLIGEDGVNEETRTVLESKKQLAYEYLKKILPPVYRHNIKAWSLEEKGGYCILDSDDENAENETLSYLLSEALRGWVDSAFFRYIPPENDFLSESDQEYGQNGAKGVIPYTFHLFDHTSRGLNNVYNLLKEIKEKRDREQASSEEKQGYFLEEKKQLLDTVISSKQVYNQYRDKLNGMIFRIDESEKEGRVFFDNALAIIYKETHRESLREKSNEEINSLKGKKDENKRDKNEKESSLSYHISDPTERFSLFILVDFAARIFYGKDYNARVRDEVNYRKLKKKAMEDLFFNPLIVEKAMSPVENYNGILDKMMLETDTSVKAILKMTMYDVNARFLTDGDLVFNLAYYRSFVLDRVLTLYQEPQISESIKAMELGKNPVPADVEQHMIISFWQAITSIAKLHGEKTSDIVARYYEVFSREFTYIETRMSGIPLQNMVIRLFSQECAEALERIGNSGMTEWRQLQRIVLNTIAEQQPKGKEASKKEEGPWEKKDDGGQSGDGDVGQEEKEELIEEKRRKMILAEIAKNNLWNEIVVKAKLEGYLSHWVKAYFKQIVYGLHIKNDALPEWKINISASEEKWNQFYRSYDGVSQTKAKKTKGMINGILSEHGESWRGNIQYATYKKIMDELQDLAWSRAWYGTGQAQELIKCLQEAFAEPENLVKSEKEGGANTGSGEGWEKFRKYYRHIACLTYYYDYKIATDLSGQLNWEAEKLKEITENMSFAHRDADKNVLNTFIDRLNHQLDLDDQIDDREFEKLFSV